MKEIVLGFFGILAALASVFIVSAQQQYNCPGMMGGLYGGYGSGMMILSWLTWLLVVALIIAAIYWLVKSANRKR